MGDDGRGLRSKAVDDVVPHEKSTVEVQRHRLARFADHRRIRDLAAHGVDVQVGLA
jgi:hypothetical protein